MGKISISLNNTCAFDALVHLFATSYCDCKTFRQFVDANDSPLLNLAKHISCKGVQAEAYKMRAEMLYNNLSEDCREMAFGIVNVNCAHTPSFIALKLKTPASIIDIRVCSSRYCPYVTSGERIPVLSARPEILLKNGIQSLQEAIEANDSPDISDCSKPFSPSELPTVPKQPEYVKNLPIDPTYSKYVLCAGQVRHTKQPQQFVLVSVMGNQETVINKNDLSSYERPVKCRLEEIPTNIMIRNVLYHLRGVIAFDAPNIQRAAKFTDVPLGHYTSYCRRLGGKWDLFDDTKSKQEPVKSCTEAKIDTLLYTKQ